MKKNPLHRKGDVIRLKKTKALVRANETNLGVKPLQQLLLEELDGTRDKRFLKKARRLGKINRRVNEDLWGQIHKQFPALKGVHIIFNNLDYFVTVKEDVYENNPTVDADTSTD